MTPTIWTEAVSQAVLSMAEDGFRYDEIAALFGTTRNAISGVVHRCRRGEPVGARRPRPPRRPLHSAPFRKYPDYAPAKHPFAPDDSCPDFAWDELHCSAVLANGGYPVLERRAA